MTKRVAAVHDLSGLGRCSLTAAIPVLSALGVQVCPLPTGVFSNQTGFPRYFAVDGSDWMDRFIDEWRACGLTLDGIYTGFLSNVAQVDGIERLIAAFRMPDTLLLVDPVMGDGGHMYATYTEDMCRRVAALASGADVLTPNLTEACLLTHTDYGEFTAYKNEPQYIERVAALAGALASETRQVVITGVEQGEDVYNVAAGREQFALRSHRIRGHFSGTGDLFASTVCGCMVQGRTLREGVEAATRLLDAALHDTDGAAEHGVEFERHLNLLTEL